VLLVVTELPSSPAPEETAARLTGQAVADVRNRLAGPLPRVLLVEPDSARAQTLATALEAEGFAAIACDPRLAPGDDDRLVARALEWATTGELVVTDTAGAPEVVTASSLVLIQRGVRVTTTAEITKQKERRFSVGRALLSGGLILTKRVETQSTRTTTQSDPFLLLHRRDGQPDVVLYEHRLDYRFLGAAMQPTSVANFEILFDRLRAWAPTVLVDERAALPALLNGLPVPATTRVDLALWLIWLAHLRRSA
jgi:hypothetical protein